VNFIEHIMHVKYQKLLSEPREIEVRPRFSVAENHPLTDGAPQKNQVICFICFELSITTPHKIASLGAVASLIHDIFQTRVELFI
jgi:hypothetical protein